MVVSRDITFREQESVFKHEISEKPKVDVDLGLEKESDSQPTCTEDVKSIEAFKVDHASQSNINAPTIDEGTLQSDAGTQPSRSTRAKKYQAHDGKAQLL